MALLLLLWVHSRHRFGPPRRPSFYSTTFFLLAKKWSHQNMCVTCCAIKLWGNGFSRQTAAYEQMTCRKLPAKKKGICMKTLTPPPPFPSLQYGLAWELIFKEELNGATLAPSLAFPFRCQACWDSLELCSVLHLFWALMTAGDTGRRRR